MSLTESSGGLSAADVAAVMNGNGNNGNGFGFGGDGAWWLLVLFLFAFGGNGWGNGFGGGNPGFVNVDNGVQRGFDQSAVMSGINSLNAAVTNGFSNSAISTLQGFNGLGMQLSNDRFDVVNAITNTGYNLQSQMMANEMARQQCCCDTKAAIADLKYTVATENCADRAAVSDGIREIIANQNANTQSIKDMLCQQEIETLKTQNTNLQTQLNMQNLAASQATQTAQLMQDNNVQTQALIQRIAPYPVPSYNVPNPYANQGCGCYANMGCGSM